MARVPMLQADSIAMEPASTGPAYSRGCTYPQALNYSGAANVDDGSCVFVGILNEVGPCLFDVSSDGIVNTPDLLIFLQYWEATCE